MRRLLRKAGGTDGVHDLVWIDRRINTPLCMPWLFTAVFSFGVNRRKLSDRNI